MSCFGLQQQTREVRHTIVRARTQTVTRVLVGSLPTDEDGGGVANARRQATVQLPVIRPLQPPSGRSASRRTTTM